MKTTVLIFLIAAVTLCAAAADSAFELVVTADRATYEVGEVPNITFRITNKTAKEVVLVGYLDGSRDGRRFPKFLFEILDAAGKPITIDRTICKFMNDLNATDFVVVPAGDAFEPLGKGFSRLSGFHPFQITTPGDYTLRFSYSTSDRVQDYFGLVQRRQPDASPEIQRLFERVPKLDLKSNELKLKFTAKPK